MQIKKILAILGEQSGQIQTAGNARTFVPKALRESLEVGDFAVIDSRSYDRSKMEDDAEGEFSGPAFTREEVVHTGDFQSCVAIAHETEVNAMAAKVTIAGLAKNLSLELTAAPKANVPQEEIAM